MKFSIRDILLVTTIVALAVGWWVDRATYSGLRQENVRIRQKLKETDRMLKETVYALSRKEDHPMPELPNPSASTPNPRKP